MGSWAYLFIMYIGTSMRFCPYLLDRYGYIYWYHKIVSISVWSSGLSTPVLTPLNLPPTCATMSMPLVWRMHMTQLAFNKLAHCGFKFIFMSLSCCINKNPFMQNLIFLVLTNSKVFKIIRN